MKGLRAIRKKLGISLMNLEELTGVDMTSLSRYERGAVVPSIEMAQKIANTLDISVDELINGPDKQEFEVKILMGVKSLAGVAGIEVADNSFLFGVQDDKPQIHLAGMVNIATLEDRKNAAKEIMRKFWQACWMFDNKDKADTQDSTEVKE